MRGNITNTVELHLHLHLSTCVEPLAQSWTLLTVSHPVPSGAGHLRNGGSLHGAHHQRRYVRVHLWPAVRREQQQAGRGCALVPVRQQRAALDPAWRQAAGQTHGH